MLFYSQFQQHVLDVYSLQNKRSFSQYCQEQNVAWILDVTFPRSESQTGGINWINMLSILSQSSLMILIHTALDDKYAVRIVFYFFHFFVLLLSVPPCPVICNSGERAPVPYGVGTTFVGQFHIKRIIK